MKKTAIFIMLFFLSVVLVSASCQDVTYYSRKDWVKQYNFIDVSFDGGQPNFINGDNIVTSLNWLGTHSFPNTVSSEYVNGNKTYQVSSNIDVNNQRFVSIVLGQSIKVDTIEFEIDGYDSFGQIKEKEVYINAPMYRDNGKITIKGGELIYRGKDEGRQIVAVGNKEIDNIYILFKDVKASDTYQASYFQINEYSVLKHVAWTKEYIANTDTYTDSICLEGGEFTPNGTPGYVYDVNTSFSPNVDLISDYIPKISSQHGVYDFGRGSYISAYSIPDVVKNVDQHAYRIEGWRRSSVNNSPLLRYTSYGSEGDEYVAIDGYRGVKYYANPVYWTQQNHLPYKIISSYNRGWCQHTTGSQAVPCYKYSGHSSNARYNSYDVRVLTYENVVPPEMRYFSHGEYYLINQDTGVKELLYQGVDSQVNFHLSKTGIYKIEGVLHDAVGNTGKVLSKSFYIDQEAPLISFSPNGSNWINKTQKVLVEVRDQHSGIDSWEYRLGENSFKKYHNNETAVLLDQEGIHQIEVVAKDKIGNDAKKTSIEYKLDFTKPSAIFEMNDNVSNKVTIHVSDALSGVDKWRYAVSVDGGRTYGAYSGYIYDSISHEIELTLEKAIRIKVEVIDKATNKSIVESDLIETYNSVGSIGKMYAEVYDIDQESLSTLYVECDKCQLTENRKLKIYIDNELVEQQTIEIDKQGIELQIEFIPLKSNIELSVELYKADKLESTISLNVYAKSKQHQISDNEVLFKDIVGSYIEQGQPQTNYYETLSIIGEPLRSDYFQGEGLQVAATVEYLNECQEFKEWVCMTSNEISYEEVYSVFDNGAIPIKNEYENDLKYIVPMTIVREEMIVLPVVYVDKYTGEVHKDTNDLDDYIIGDRRWYTDKKIELGRHIVVISGKGFGVNDFSFDVELPYNIIAKLEDQYQARFINPENPYLREHSIWQEYREWFETLN